MKNICLSILFGLTTMSLFAQAPLIQNGLVREQNSGKRPVEGVQIIFSSAPPTDSEQSGKFRLVFKDKKAGDLVFMTEVSKKGYELVNDKELQHVKLSSTEQLNTDIIVAKVGVIEAAKKDYYAISDKALKAGFEKQKALLRGELDKARLSEKQFQDQFETLQDQFENQRKELDNLAEKFAKVNFDDVSALYQEALQLFKDGKIDEAIKKLESADLMGRTDKRLKERERIANESAINEKGIQEDIKSLKLQADLYVLKLHIAKAEGVYDRLLLLDSTNLNILTCVADFYRENHRYEKALRLYSKIIAHPQAEAWQKANAYAYLGELYTIIGDLNKAIIANLKSYEIYTPLSKNAPNDKLYKHNLAVSYGKLGGTYTKLGNLEKALHYYQEGNRLDKELDTSYPNNIDFKNGLAISYEKLGITHTSLGNLDMALRFFEKDIELAKELYIAYPTNVNLKDGLAGSYQYLGNTHTSLGNLDKALNFYEDGNKLSKELYANSPNNVSFKSGLASSYSCIGSTHVSLGDLKNALIFFEECNRLQRELCTVYPTNVSFKYRFAGSYLYLGHIYFSFGNLKKALLFFENEAKLSEELYALSSANVDFKNGLAVSYSRLGETHTSLGNFDKALSFYEKNIALVKELYTTYSTNVDYKDGLAISYAQLGDFSRDKLKDKTKAYTYFKQAEALWKELVRDAPQYALYQKFLTKVQGDLKALD